MTTMKPGDILIFEAGDNWISKSIARLTNSTVSHAAMRYTGETMVEMGSHGIVVSGCREAESGEKAYLLRLEPERDSAVLLAAAKAYVEKGTKYDYPDLIFLAGLLIYRSVRPTPRWRKITDYLLELACYELDKLINKWIHTGGEPAMVCSQLVYQCYLDCGKDYQIAIQGGPLQASGLDQVCLADLVQGMELQERDAMPLTGRADLPVPDLEELARELYDAIDEADGAQNTAVLDTSCLSGTLNLAKRFMDLVEELLERAGVELPVRALFVTPSDLLEHAVNLRQYDTGKITRS